MNSRNPGVPATPRAQRPPAPLPRDELAAVLEPGGSGCMLPAAAYTNDDVLAWEREQFFDRAWVCAGRSGDLAAAGARRAVRVGNDRALLVRGDDGTLRAFYNVCRHRGHELMACGGPAVTRGAIHCPYHAWTYDLAGDLTATPRFNAPPSFDRTDHGLVPMRVEEWRGFAMVNPSGDAPALSVYLGAFDELLAPWEPERLVVAASHEYVLQANWKLPIENYQECYHCAAIHPELCVVSPPDSGDNYTLPGMWVGGAMALADHAQTMSLDGQSRGVVLPGLSAEQARTVLYVGVFPNLLLSAHPDYVMTHRIEPVSPTETWVECQWLFDPAAISREGFDPAYAVDFWDITNRQDWDACEGVQRGVSSRGYRPGPFGLQEDAVQQFVHLVARSYLAGDLVA